MSLIRKYHNHTLLTNSRHHEEELQDTRKTNRVKQLALSSPSRLLQNLKGHIAMYNKTWNKHRTPQWEQQSITNQQQKNRRLRTTNPFLVICMEKQYSENVSIYAFDNNTRLKNTFTCMLNMQDNTGISFYIVSI